jgi:tRNA nucleotidyltransferase/poly(A) polymerase
MKNIIYLDKFDERFIKVIKEFRSVETRFYLTGGAIRDMLNHITPADYDIITDTPIHLIVEFLKKNHQLKIAWIENRINPLIRIDIDQELVLDFSPLKGSLIDNLNSRDFSVNSLGLNLNELIDNKKAEIISTSTGLSDTKEKLLDPITKYSIRNDPLRIIRSFRFKLYNDYEFSNTLINDIQKYSYLLNNAKGERIWMELSKIIIHPNSYKIIKEMIETDVLENIFQDIKKMKAYKHDKPPAETLMEHSLYTYMKMEDFLNNNGKGIINVDSIYDIPVLKLSALLHDVGKLYTKRYVTDNEFHFYNHEIVGSKIAILFARNSLSLSNVLANYLGMLVKNHMRSHLFTRIEKLSDHAIYRFIRDCDGHIEDAICLSIADALSTNSRITKLSGIAKQINRYIGIHSKKEIKSLLDGNEIMNILTLKPSKKIAIIKDELIKMQIERKIDTKNKAINFIKRYKEN